MYTLYFWVYMIGYWVPAFWFYLQDIRIFRIFKRIDDITPGELHKIYIATIPHILFNQIFLHFPILYYLSNIVNNTPESITNDAIHLVFNNIVNVLLFSIFHHMLHSPFIYSSIHKFHHQHKQTIAITSEYNHPIEEFLTWTIATWCPIILFPLSHKAMILYSATQAMYGVIGHAGYLIPGFQEDVIRHNIHHKLFKYNYSGFKMYDIIMGTNYIDKEEA